MAREWERGTMEALLVTPVAIREILIGKIVPYFLLGMGSMILAGDVWPVLLPNAAALVVMTVFFFALIRRKTHKRLD